MDPSKIIYYRSGDCANQPPEVDFKDTCRNHLVADTVAGKEGDETISRQILVNQSPPRDQQDNLTGPANADAAAGPQAMTLNQAIAAMREHARLGFGIMPTVLGLQLLTGLDRLRHAEGIMDDFRQWADRTIESITFVHGGGMAEQFYHDLINLRAAAVLQRDLRK